MCSVLSSPIILTYLSLLDEKGAVEDVFDGGGETVPIEDEGEVVDGLLPALLVPGYDQVVKMVMSGHISTPHMENRVYVCPRQNLPYFQHYPIFSTILM